MSATGVVVTISWLAPARVTPLFAGLEPGDTAWTPALLDAAAGSDVFACEAYTYDRAVRFHLDYATLRVAADQLRTHRVVVTDIGPSMLRKGLDELDHTAASDGLVLQT